MHEEIMSLQMHYRALLRKNQLNFFLISMPQFAFLNDLRKKLASSVEYQELQDKIQNDLPETSQYNIAKNLILCKGRIWLPSDCSFIKLLLAEFHQTPTGGHLGVQKTLQRLQENFMWKSIREDTSICGRMHDLSGN